MKFLGQKIFVSKIFLDNYLRQKNFIVNNNFWAKKLGWGFDNFLEYNKYEYSTPLFI